MDGSKQTMFRAGEDIKSRLRNHTEKSKVNSPDAQGTTPSPKTPKKQPKQSSSKKKTPIVNPKSPMDKKKEEKMTTGGKGKPMTMESLADLITGLTTKVRGLKQDIADVKDSKSKVTSLETIVKEEKEKLNTTVNTVNADSLKLQMLTAIVIKQDARIEELTKEVKQLRKQQKKANSFISGLIKTDTEETKYHKVEIVKNFFKDQMNITEEIPIRDAYRQGLGNLRQMCVIFENTDDKYKILSKSSVLKGKKNVRRKLYFIDEDLIDEDRELRNYMKQLRRETATATDKMKINIRKGKLFVNNEVVKTKVEIPTAGDILTMEKEELDEVFDTKTYENAIHEESGSEFKVFYQRAHTEQEVQKGYAKMKVHFGDATHVVMAYRLEGAIGPYKQAYLDDGENGAGRAMLNIIKNAMMENVAIYIVRYYGGQNLGRRHFEVYENMTKDALRSLKSKLEKLERANRMRRSHSQLLQLSQLSVNSFNSLNDEEVIINTTAEIQAVDASPDENKNGQESMGNHTT